MMIEELPKRVQEIYRHFLFSAQQAIQGDIQIKIEEWGNPEEHYIPPEFIETVYKDLKEGNLSVISGFKNWIVVYKENGRIKFYEFTIISGDDSEE